MLRRCRVGREGAVADDFSGDTLAHLALAARIEQHRVVGMGVDVDEAGADHLAGGVDHVGCLRRREVANGGDTAVADADVGALGRSTGAVYYHAAAENDVERSAVA